MKTTINSTHTYNIKCSNVDGVDVVMTIKLCNASHGAAITGNALVSLIGDDESLITWVSDIKNVALRNGYVAIVNRLLVEVVRACGKEVGYDLSVDFFHPDNIDVGQCAAAQSYLDLLEASAKA